MRAATVVLVHGLWMHGTVMEPLRYRLRQAGFDAVTYSYPSVRGSLTENADRLQQFAGSLHVTPLHWVGHSLGGLVILRMLQRAGAQLPSGRVVVLGTPFHGSAAAQVLEGNALGTHVLGRSMREWLQVPPPTTFGERDIGVVAGTLRFGLGRLIVPDLLLPNDGVVTVTETAVPGARDHIVLPVTHTGMLVSRVVARQVRAFLREGHFEPVLTDDTTNEGGRVS